MSAFLPILDQLHVGGPLVVAVHSTREMVGSTPTSLIFPFMCFGLCVPLTGGPRAHVSCTSGPGDYDQ